MSTIEFTLFAPTIAEAQLIGSFSEWNGIPMQCDNGTFRCSTPLADGTYEYKFRIRRKKDDQEWVDVNDPYVKLYDPERNTGSIMIEKGQSILDNYQWQHDDVPLPANKDLIIYELYVADFTEQGTFLGLIEKLDYLTDLGVNCIELLPIQGKHENESLIQKRDPIEINRRIDGNGSRLGLLHATLLCIET